MNIRFWDGKTPINNCPADDFLQRNPDLIGQTVILLETDGVVRNITSADTLKYNNPEWNGLTDQEVAEAWMNSIENPAPVVDMLSEKELLQMEANTAIYEQNLEIINMLNQLNVKNNG